MNKNTPQRGALWLLVLFLGLAFGAGLYEMRIEVPQWLAVSGAGLPEWHGDLARRADSGLRFWAFVTTGPLTLLTLANLPPAWRSRRTGPRTWLWAAGILLVERLFTFGYFIPVLVGLMDSNRAGAELTATAQQWQQLNYARLGLSFAAWLCALHALSRINVPKAPTSA